MTRLFDFQKDFAQERLDRQRTHWRGIYERLFAPLEDYEEASPAEDRNGIDMHVYHHNTHETVQRKAVRIGYGNILIETDNIDRDGNGWIHRPNANWLLWVRPKQGLHHTAGTPGEALLIPFLSLHQAYITNQALWHQTLRQSHATNPGYTTHGLLLPDNMLWDIIPNIGKTNFTYDEASNDAP